MRKQLYAPMLVIGLLGCTTGGQGTEATRPATQPAETLDGLPSAATNTLPAVTLQLEESAGPQDFEFAAADGTPLVGTFWPPAADSAPGVLLMHWNPGSREDWTTLAGLLQGQALAAPTGSDRQSYAVFAFDFRGHGDSGGEQDRDGYLDDARAALALFRELPGVDPDRIVLLGASIGADAAVDICAEGCIGAISLSPGSYLGVPYRDAVAALGDRPALCAASEGDTTSADACREGQDAGLTDYQAQFYEGTGHAMEMFGISDQPPALTDLIFEWLRAHAP